MSSTVVPAIIAIRMRRYKQAFRAAGATSPARAIRPAEKGLRESLVFHKLVRESILVSVGDGRFYLDETRDEVVMRTRQKLLLILIVIILVILIGSAITALWH
jgi:hypothetical protein